MPPWLFNVFMDGVMKEENMGMGKRGVSYMEDGREWRLPSLSYADDLVLYNKSEENLRVIASKSNVMILNGEEGLECEVHVDGIRLVHVSEFKYLGCFGRIRYR